MRPQLRFRNFIRPRIWGEQIFYRLQDMLINLANNGVSDLGLQEEERKRQDEEHDDEEYEMLRSRHRKRSPRRRSRPKSEDPLSSISGLLRVRQVFY